MSFFVAFNSCQENKLKEIEVVNPTLKIIQIPSEALLTVESGSVLIKRRGSQLYKKVDSRLRLTSKDILKLEKGAKIKIGFADNSYLVIGPVDHATWYTFEYMDHLGKP
jgi:hypothetical protein